MRILYMTSCFGLGGTEFYTLDYAEKMLKLGHSVSWATAGAGDFSKISVDEGIEFFQLPIDKRTPLHAYLTIRKLRRLVKKNSFDIIHATDAYSAMLCCMALKKFKNRPKIVWSNVGIGSKTYAIMKKHCEGTLDLILAVSNFIRNRMIEEGFDYSKIVVYSQARAPQESSASPSEWRGSFGISEGDILIGSVGRIAKMKGNETVVRALVNVRKSFPNAKLALVGDGDDRARLEQLSRELGIGDAVIFTGWQNNVANAYAAFDAVVFPTYFEALGYVTYEALYYGKPLIASLTGGIPEYIKDGYNGLLVQPANEKEWADTIIRLLSDKNLQGALAKNGKEYYEQTLAPIRENSIIDKLYSSIL